MFFLQTAALSDSQANLPDLLITIGYVIGLYGLIMWAVLIIWVTRDIFSRTSSIFGRLFSLGLTIFFPFFSLPVYLVLRPNDTIQDRYERELGREAILAEMKTDISCADCLRPIQENWLYCPHCAKELKKLCTSSDCKELLHFSWSVCPTCGVSAEIIS